MKDKVRETADYWIALEYSYGMYFLHSEVTNWNKSVCKAMKADLRELVDEHGTLYALYNNDKQAKFMRLMGLEYEVTLDKDDGTGTIDLYKVN